MLVPPFLRVNHHPQSMIDRIDTANHPSLKGYWKCNDGGITVRDYSQYGNHLALELSGDGFASIDGSWGNKPGFLSIKNHDRAYIALTASLTTAAKFVVVSCEIEHQNVLSDCDLGTAWNSDGIATGEYRGFSIAPLGDVFAFRVTKYTPGVGDWPANPAGDLTMSQAVATGQPLGTPIGIAGVFRPATSVSLTVDGGALITAATMIDTLTSQSGTFALGAANLNLSSDGYTAIRNYQLWAFDTAPPRLDDTLRWMGRHPGLVPWWWT